MTASDEIEIDVRWHDLTIQANVYLGETPHGNDPPEVIDARVLAKDGTTLALLLDGEDELVAALIEAARDAQGDEDDEADTWDRTK